MDYPEIIAEIVERTQDANVPNRHKVFTKLAESNINKSLRLSEMEEVATLTTDDDGMVALPADFLQKRYVSLGGRPLNAQTLPDIKSNAACGYAIQGSKLYCSNSQAEITLHYYKQIPSVLDGTNWLIESEPEIYIYAIMQQVFLSSFEMEKAVASKQYLDDLLDRLHHDDLNKRYLGTRMTVRGPTP